VLGSGLELGLGVEGRFSNGRGVETRICVQKDQKKLESSKFLDTELIFFNPHPYPNPLWLGTVRMRFFVQLK
jgi:hypothetical protein